MEVEVARSGDISERDLVALRAFLNEAFDGRFDDGNWANALGGTHVIIRDRGEIVAHGSVVPRTLYFSLEGDAWRDATAREVGYVESVAVSRGFRRRGLGTDVLNIVNQIVVEQFGFGALATSSHAYYERAGWKRWGGRTFVYKDGDVSPTPGGEQ